MTAQSTVGLDAALAMLMLKAGNENRRIIAATNSFFFTGFHLQANTNNKFDLTASVKCTFTSALNVTATCTIYQISAGQTIVTDADECILKEGS
jgi:hypothetical protein